MAGEAGVGLLDACASSPREVYACLRVIRQRPESTFRFLTPRAAATWAIDNIPGPLSCSCGETLVRVVSFG